MYIEAKEDKLLKEVSSKYHFKDNDLAPFPIMKKQPDFEKEV